jgi:hypothetical protein
MASQRHEPDENPMPTWVKASLIVTAAVALLLVALLLLGHGPDQHIPEEADPVPVVDAPLDEARPG